MIRYSMYGSSDDRAERRHGSGEQPLPEPDLSTPAPLAISVPSGLAAMAVSHSADDTLRLAMPEYIRNAPSRRRSTRSGFAPAASAREYVSGYRTPERAVLLGNAGAMTASSTKIE